MQDRSKHAAKLSDRLLEIGRDCAKRLKDPFRAGDHGDLLYDERGYRHDSRLPSAPNFGSQVKRRGQECPRHMTWRLPGEFRL